MLLLTIKNGKAIFYSKRDDCEVELVISSPVLRNAIFDLVDRITELENSQENYELLWHDAIDAGRVKNAQIIDLQVKVEKLEDELKNLVAETLDIREWYF